MWYFSWILGIGLACSFAILNAMWFEVHADSQGRLSRDDS
jgi:cyd operon protein YbgT